MSSPNDVTSVPAVAIVVAAGSGSRLGADLPKALVPVAGVPLVTRAVAALAAGGVESVVIAVPAGAGEAFVDALGSPPVPVTLVTGGESRQQSVAHALAALAPGHDDQAVLVHDAARAFVPAEVVRRVIDAVAAGADAVVPVVDVSDSVRELNDTGSLVVDRSTLRAVQTPQGFRRCVIEEAHEALAENQTVVTDDAAAVEYVHHHVTLVEGDRAAFKVTDPFDLFIAEALVRADA